ncbi:hypothetical protein Efla_000429 [Eimeria flavescens]
MGNQLLKQYNLEREPIIPGTRHGRWTVYKGRYVDRPTVEVSLFTCTLRAVERGGPPSGALLQQQLQDLLQQDAQLLQRLRHPRLLQVVDPFQHSKDSWVFCSKPVVLSLRQLLQGAPGGLPEAGAPPEGGGPLSQQQQHQQQATRSGVTSLSSSSSRPEQQRAGEESAAAAAAAAASAGGVREAWWHEPPSLLEVQCGLADVAEALLFLHKSARLLHLNIHPESVFVDRQGRWKVGGLFFAQQIKDQEEEVDCPFSFGSGSAGVALSPPLCFTAPEVTRSHPARASAAADVFSFALLVASCLGASTLPSCRDGDTEAHQLQCRGLSPLRASSFPPDSLFQQGAAAAAAGGGASAAAAAAAGLLQLLSRALSAEPAERPPLEAFLSDAFLLSTEARALRFLSCLEEKEQQQQQQFLLGLLPLLQQQQLLQHKRLLRTHILDPLLSALKSVALLPVLLPNVFAALKKASLLLLLFPLLPFGLANRKRILLLLLWLSHANEVAAPCSSSVFSLRQPAKKLDDAEFFRQWAWPRMQPLLTAKEIQVEAVVCLVEEFSFLVECSKEETREKELLPFLLKCLDIQAVQIQQAALLALKGSLSVFDYTAQRTLLLPRVLSLIRNAESSGVRLAGLQCLSAMARAFDRAAIQSQILPAIEQVSRADRSPQVCTEVSATLSCLSSSLSLAATAESVLPIFMRLLHHVIAFFSRFLSLLPMRCGVCTVEDSLSLQEYQKIDGEVKQIMRRVEEDRQKHFALKAEQQSAVEAALPSSSVPPSSVSSSSISAVTFESLLAHDAHGLMTAGRRVTSSPPPPPAPHQQPQQQQQQQQQHEEDFDDLFTSLSARLSHETTATTSSSNSSSSSSCMQQPRASEGGESDLERILFAASAAVPQSNKPSFDAFADLVKPPIPGGPPSSGAPPISGGPPAIGGLPPFSSGAADSLAAPAACEFNAAKQQTADPFAGLGLHAKQPQQQQQQPFKMHSSFVVTAKGSNGTGFALPAADPFASLSLLDGSSSSGSSRLNLAAPPPSPAAAAAAAGRAPACSDPFACLNGAAASDPFADLAGALEGISLGSLQRRSS